MDFTATYSNHTITARVNYDGSVNYMTEAIQEKGKSYTSAKEFDSLDAIKTAIDKYELTARKNFTNKTAYMVDSGYRSDEGTVKTVEVTSLTPDGQDAWIKDEKGDRRKVRRESLYSTEEACQLYLRTMKTIVGVYELRKRNCQEVLNQSQWQPEAKP